MAERAETTARAIITIGDRLLVARGKQDMFCHLPGGHVESGEDPADALVRELHEECGRTISSMQKVGEIDNVFDKGSTRVREKMHVYRAKLYPERVEHPPRSMEDHLQFKWIAMADMHREKLLPPAVYDMVRLYGGA